MGRRRPLLGRDGAPVWTPGSCQAGGGLAGGTWDSRLWAAFGTGTVDWVVCNSNALPGPCPFVHLLMCTSCGPSSSVIPREARVVLVPRPPLPGCSASNVHRLRVSEQLRSVRGISAIALSPNKKFLAAAESMADGYMPQVGPCGVGKRP